MSCWSRRIARVVIPLLICCGCDSSPELLRGGGNAGEASELVSIAYLKSLYTVVPLSIDREISIEGYIVSDDDKGNHYKTVYIEDESGGIAVRLDGEELFKTYRWGHKIRIRCNSLTLGSYGGELQLGMRSVDFDYAVSPIAENIAASAITLYDDQYIEPLPSQLTIEELSGRHVGCYVVVEDVRFVESNEGLLWCDPDTESPRGGYLTTNRHLRDERGNILIVRTNGRADFAGETLPQGTGSVKGILSYFNGEYQLILNVSYDAII